MWLLGRIFCCDVTTILIKNMMCICFVSLSSFHMSHSVYFCITLFVRNRNLKVCDRSYFGKVNRFKNEKSILLDFREEIKPLIKLTNKNFYHGVYF